MRRHRGFTLLELSAVVALISVLAVVSVPTYRFLILRAYTQEARGMLEALAHAELAYHRDNGAFLAVPPSRDEPPRGTAVPFLPAPEAFHTLGVILEGTTRYRYEVVLDGDTFVAIATGDLDGDGVFSRFELRGDTLALQTEDALE